MAWPVLVDSAREFEDACDVETISLQNIYQVRYISGEGELKKGRWDDLPGTIEVALKDATWRIDPETIPASLKGAWKAVESKNYSAGAKAIKTALKSDEKNVKQAATELLSLTMGDMKKRGGAAWKLGKSGDKFRAFVALDALCKDFDGFKIPSRVVAARDSLGKSDAVQQEVKASKIVTAAEALIETGEEKKIATANKRLAAAIKRFPKTESAAKAKVLLAQLEKDEEEKGHDEEDHDEDDDE